MEEKRLNWQEKIARKYKPLKLRHQASLTWLTPLRVAALLETSRTPNQQHQQTLDVIYPLDPQNAQSLPM